VSLSAFDCWGSVNDIFLNSAMRFLENTELLKIEDILPFFPDFVVIDDFKEEICTALEGYSAHIEKLKSEMEEATKNAEAIKKDITELKGRFVTVEAGERCSKCSYPLLTRQFYAFPCQHSFHADCLIGLVKEYLPQHELRKIVALQTELFRNASSGAGVAAAGLAAPTIGSGRGQRTLLSAAFVNALPNGRSAVTAANSIGRNVLAAGSGLRDLIIPESLAGAIGIWGGRNSRAGEVGGAGEREPKTEKVREALDELLGRNCPLCESVIEGLDKPFEDDEDDSWKLSN